MKALILSLFAIFSLKTFAQNNFDPDAVLAGLTVHNLSYKLSSCQTGLGSAKAELNWLFNNNDKIDQIDFAGLDDYSGLGRTFLGLFPLGQNTPGFVTSLTPTGMEVNEYDKNNLARASKEIVFSSGITQIQYKQIYHETGSVLDCTYKLESIQ